MQIKKLVLAIGVVLLGGSAYGDQLLTNPDFETGSLSPWTNDNSVQAGSWTIISSGCNTGTYCVTVSADVGLQQMFWFGAASTDLITAADFWVNPTNTITIALLYQGGATDYFFFTPTVGQVGVWDNVDFLSDLRTNAYLTGIDIFGFSGSATKLDDFNIVGTIPEPGAFWLLGAGLGAFVALGRARKNVRKRA